MSERDVAPVDRAVLDRGAILLGEAAAVLEALAAEKRQEARWRHDARGLGGVALAIGIVVAGAWFAGHVTVWIWPAVLLVALVVFRWGIEDPVPAEGDSEPYRRARELRDLGAELREAAAAETG